MAASKIPIPRLQVGCKLCDDSLQEPRQLPCGHVFCTRCILGHIRAYGTSGYFECPECMQRFRSPSPLSLARVRNDFYKFEDKTDDDMCPQEGHNKKVLLYCSTHSTVVCAECIKTLHSQCKLDPLAEVSDELKQELTTKSQNLKTAVDRKRKTLEESKQDANKKTKILSAVEAEVDNTARFLVQYVNGEKKKLVKHLAGCREKLDAAGRSTERQWDRIREAESIIADSDCLLQQPSTSRLVTAGSQTLTKCDDISNKISSIANESARIQDIEDIASTSTLARMKSFTSQKPRAPMIRLACRSRTNALVVSLSHIIAGHDRSKFLWFYDISNGKLVKKLTFDNFTSCPAEMVIINENMIEKTSRLAMVDMNGVLHLFTVDQVPSIKDHSWAAACKTKSMTCTRNRKLILVPEKEDIFHVYDTKNIREINSVNCLPSVKEVGVVLQQGDLYVVSDLKSGNVKWFTPSGKVLYVYTGTHTVPLRDAYIMIQCNFFNNILILDEKNNCIHEVNSEGNFVRMFADGSDGIGKPTNVHIDYAGRVYIAHELTGKQQVNIIHYLKDN